MTKDDVLKLAEIEEALADMVLVKGQYVPQTRMVGSEFVTTAQNSRLRAKALRALAGEMK